MIRPAIPLALLALAASAAMAQDAPRSLQGVELAQLSIHERIIIRIPRLVPQSIPSGRSPLPLPPSEWREKKGPECLPMAGLAGAMVAGRDSIDLLLAGGERMRAKLDGDCKPLDFYSAYYIRRTQDGQVCADRDSIRARSGATCAITKFRRLEAKR